MLEDFYPFNPCKIGFTHFQLINHYIYLFQHTNDYSAYLVLNLLIGSETLFL